MNGKRLSGWMMCFLLFLLLGLGEIVHAIYLAFSGGLNFEETMYFAMEILVFLLVALFCRQKEQKRRRKEEREGPLLTEQQKKQMKNHKKEKLPIVIVPEGKPYLVMGIVFYLAFLVNVIVVILSFSWPKTLLAAVLGGISGYDVYKYMRIKTDLAAAKDREEILQRKKAARREALARRKAEEEKKARQQAEADKAKEEPAQGDE